MENLQNGFLLDEEKGSSEALKSLSEVLKSAFFNLKLSKNTMTYEDFEKDQMASISSSYSGFGLF